MVCVDDRSVDENADHLYHLMKNWLDGKTKICSADILETRRIIEDQYSLKVWVQKIMEYYCIS